MRSVVEWLCHTEDLMKAHVREDVSADPQGFQDIQGTRIFLFIRFILITLFILITRISRDTGIHIKCS